MAFLKYAKAKVVRPNQTLQNWLSQSRSLLQTSDGLRSASSGKILLKDYDPKEYLLTHCTIVASVDTEDAQQPLGDSLVDGFQVKRQYKDWLITPETSKYVNNNHDSWERKLLLATFKTFVGGENYVEHVQIPELSKGKILDAVSRDIGDSVYIDILVATHRKHEALIRAIESKQLQTLSMSCQVAFTICSKCGNVAHDETDMCPHIRYQKGNTFVDEVGKTRVIAELCGHVDAEPGSVRFFEASWVAHPAFTGAVLRSFITPTEITPDLEKSLKAAYDAHQYTIDPSEFVKAASAQKSSFGFGSDDDDDDSGKEEEEDNRTPLEKAIDDYAEKVQEKAIKKIEDELEEEQQDRHHDTSEDTNDSLVKSALTNPVWKKLARTLLRTTDAKQARKYLLGLIFLKKGGWNKVATSGFFTPQDAMILAALEQRLLFGRRISSMTYLYDTVAQIGGRHRWGSSGRFLRACEKHLKRETTVREKRILLRAGSVYDLISVKGSATF